MDQIENNIDRRTNVAYRGSSPRSSAMLAQQDVSLKKRIASIKSGLLAKSTMQEKIENDKKLAVAMATKFDQTKSLLQMYEVANAELALCLNQNAGFCDEIYQYLAVEIAAREKEIIDQMMQSWD